MTEISNETKAKAMLPYMGQPVKMVEDGKLGYLESIGLNKYLTTATIYFDDTNDDWMVYNSMDEFKLILSPLSAITDEDAIELSKILEESNDNIEDLIYFGKYWVKRVEKNESINANTCIAIYQFLQSRGYDLPNHYLNEETLFKAGLCVYKTT